MFGAPAGGCGTGGHHGSESRQSWPILPPNACSTSPPSRRSSRRGVPGVFPRASTAGSRYFVSVAEEIAIPGAGRNLKDILRYVAGVAAGVVVLLLLFGKRAEFAAAWHRLGGFTPGWLAAAAVAEAGSLWLYATLQHRVLRLTFAKPAMSGLLLLCLANDAIANTVPGGPAVSSAYR